MKNALKGEVLPIVVEGHTFKPNDEGLWSLNEIHRTLKLDPAKIASKWKNEIRKELDRRRNFVIARGGLDQGTLATEAGTIAYAMWVSPAFYLMVVDAFIAMRNRVIGEARQKDALLDANMPKATTLDLKARGAGLTWTETCRVAGIRQPRLALAALVSMGRFVYPTDSFGERNGPPQPSKQGFQVGAFVKTSTGFGNREGWRVKPRGLDWFCQEAGEINAKVDEEKARKEAAKRAQKLARVGQWGQVIK